MNSIPTEEELPSFMRDETQFLQPTSENIPNIENLPDYLRPNRYTPSLTVETEDSVATEPEIDTEQDVTSNAQHHDDLNEEAVTLLQSEKQTYDTILQDENIREAAIRMSEKYLGRDDLSPEDAIDEVLEHFNKFDVNELTAASDLNYVSSLVSDLEDAQQRGQEPRYQEKLQELNDYRLLFTAKNSLPYFWQEGGRSAYKSIGDVLEGIVTAPSTWLSMLVPVVGKVATQGGIQATKFGVTKLLQQVGKRPILTAMATEGAAGALQDIAAQKTKIQADLQKDYSLLQTGVVTAISTVAPAAVIPLTAKGSVVAFMERNTGDIIAKNDASIKKQIEQGIENAGKTLNSTEIEAQGVTKMLREKLKPLDKDAVERGLKIKEQVAERGDMGDTLTVNIRPEKYDQVLAALTDITRISLKGRDPEDLAGERISETVSKAISEIKDKALAKKGATDVDAEKAIRDTFEPLLSKYNLNYNDLADIYIADASEAGRRLQQVGKLKRSLSYLDDAAGYDYFGFNKEVKDVFKKVSKQDTKDFAKTGVLRELDQARLAIMTSQPATTVRNIAGGLIRLPIDTATRAIDTTLQRLTGVERLRPNSDEWALFEGFLNAKESRALQSIYQANFAEEYDRLFRPLLDVADASKNPNKLVPLSKISRGLNVINTVSDNWFKRVAFTGSLKRQLNDLAGVIKPKTKEDAEKYFDTFLKGKMWDDGTTKLDTLGTYYSKLGVDKNSPDAWKSIFREEDFSLVKIMERGNFHKVFGQSKEGRDAIQKATEEALYYTYQRSPENELAKTFIKAVHAVPFVGTSFAPFPRFMVNAMRFTYEYSPTFLLLNKNARSELAALAGSKTARELNDGYENVAKGLLGTAFILGAMKFRMSESAGDKWYLGKMDDGTTYDMRPFFPLAPYLYFGDLVARAYKGDPITADTNTAIIRDTLQTLTGMQLFKTGFGLYALEGAIADLERGDLKGASNILAEFASNFVETYSIPFTVPQDFYNSFFAPDDARILKDMRGPNFISTFLNKSFKRLPGNDAMYDFFEENIEGYEKPTILTTPFTGDEPIRRAGAGISRQAMGVLFRQRATEVEKEFTRLRISPNRLVRRTRNPEYNMVNNVLAKVFIDQVLHKEITSDDYKNMKASEIEIEGGEVRVYSKSEKQKLYIQHLIDKKFKPKRTDIINNLVEGSKAKDIVEAMKFERGGFKRQFYKDLAKEQYHKMINPKTNKKYGIPRNEDGYDHSILNKIVKQLEGADLDISQD